MRLATSQNLALLLGLCLLGAGVSRLEADQPAAGPIAWEQTELPLPPGGWNTSAALWEGRLYLVGPDRESREATVRWIDPRAETKAWQSAPAEFPGDLQNPALSPAPEGLLILGGRSGGVWSDAAYRWEEPGRTQRLNDLPIAPAYPAAGLLGDRPHLAGFDPQNRLVLWNLPSGTGEWSPLAASSLPEGLTAGPIAVVRQQDGDGHKLWVVAETWIAKVMPGGRMVFQEIAIPVQPAAIPVGVAHLLIPAAGGEDLLFHTVTGTWIPLNQPPRGGELRLFKRAGEGLTAVSTNQAAVLFYEGTEVRQAPRLSGIDLALLLVYFVTLIILGNWFRLRGKNTRDYFLGGNRIPGWAAGLSIVLTNVSAVSLLSIPAKAYATNWTFFLMLLTPLIAAPLVIKFILPFFYNLRITTAFEYLELRFNVSLRCIGSLQYGLYEICRMGVLILLPSIVLSVVTGIEVWVCILAIGVVATLYTLFGGLEAVVWTDVMQGVVMIGGMLLAIGIMVFRLDGSSGELATVAWDLDKLRLFDWSPNIAEVTVWTFLLALPIVLNGYVSHQPTVQRFVAARDIHDAARALWTTGITAPLILGTFFLCGTALFLFYAQFPERLNPTMGQPDQLFAWFIINELPVGVIGLMIGAIFAAAMSSLDSGLSSLSSVIVTDFYRRFGTAVTEKRALFYAKLSTAVIGVIGTGFGLWLATMNVLSLFDAFIQFASLLTGGLAGVFLLGIFTRRANGTGALIGWTVSTILVYLAKTQGDFQFYLYATIGTVSCFAVGYLVSLLTRPDARDLTGLTLWTRRKTTAEAAGAGVATCCSGGEGCETISTR